MIIKLPPEVSNQISAGEVVERPASVVKELVENAIDAGAKKIFVDIENAGKDFIRVSDDGHGILAEDISLLFERSATSKVKSIEDVYNVDSLGFRGEALASIASVSKIQLNTRHKDEKLGKKVLFYNGEIQSINDIAINSGTSFTVFDLFYNTPVRLKFMKSSSTEKSKISSIMGMLAMSRPDISFTLNFDGKEVFSTNGNGNLKDVVLKIYGKELTTALNPIDVSTNDVNISGYIAKQEYNRGNRAYQFAIVNGRVVESPFIKKVMDEAYEGFMMKHRHPAYILVINLPPNMADVNIHPQKLELKFVREDILESLLYNTVRNALIRQEASRPVDISESIFPKTFLNTDKKNTEQIYIKELINRKDILKKHNLSEENAYSSTEKSIDTHFEKIKKPVLVSEKTASKKYEINQEKESIFDPEEYKNLSSDKDLYENNDIKVPDFSDFLDEFENDIRKKVPDGPVLDAENITIVGQLFKTFILCEAGDTAFLIDQHAAHERILFEKFYKDFKEKNIETQILIEPIEYRGNPAELDSLEGAMELFESIGVILEKKDELSWLIKSVPVFKNPISKEDISYIIESFTKNGEKSYHKAFLDAVIMKSCKSAIKSGDVLNEVQMRELLKKLYECDNPHSCPHGRPATIELKRKDFDKIFKRIV